MAEAGRALNVLLITDVFPPGSGGSGWSTYYLGKALKERGHSVSVMRPRLGERVARPKRRVVEYGGLMVEEILVPASPRWASRLGMGKALSETVARRALSSRAYTAARASNLDVLHGQHSISAVAASTAARRARKHGKRVASVATVRDYWALCPSSTRLFADGTGREFECRDCHRLGEYTRCVRISRRKQPESVRKPAPTYRLLEDALSLARWLQTLRASRALAACDGVVAVSE